MSWSEKFIHLGIAGVFALVALIFTATAQSAPTVWMWILGMGGLAGGIWALLMFAIPVVHTYWDVVEHVKSRS